VPPCQPAKMGPGMRHPPSVSGPIDLGKIMSKFLVDIVQVLSIAGIFYWGLYLLLWAIIERYFLSKENYIERVLGKTSFTGDNNAQS
jgi:hypothetical protein